MDERIGWLETAETGLRSLLDSAVAFLPQLAGAAALLLTGWLLAIVLRAVTRRGVRALGWMLPRLLPGAVGGPTRRAIHPDLLAGLVFWLVILAFAAAAAQVLGLTVFAAWLDAFFSHLPLILLAGFILLAGVLISQLVRDGVLGAAGKSGLEYRALLGYSAQTTVLAAAAVIALDVVGLDITVLVVLAAILLGAVSGGAALAFGIGAQTMVGNLLGVRAVEGRIRPDDAIRVGDLEGRVVELARHAVIIETAEGRVAVPGRLFNEQPFTLLMREGDDG
ncbi:mechanosensitive ion channel [Ectothiorhodospiraceae bacterium WFHF3C12]|nr:mechanosensitive ion channel [Ectothiorhodospiraceae bacterium WFHF3C12]